ncbi:MAG: peptidoglycan-binding domain-containing protein, partial [Methanoregula sp.]
QAQENEAFRKKRPNPNVIYEGDEIVIPDKRLKEESAVTEKRHLYKLKSSVWMFRLEMRDETFKGLEGIPYELRIEGMDPIRKRTGKNGLIETRILAEASSGALLFQGEKFQLNFGGLDPVTRMSGVQQRLSNLGFKADPPGNGAAGSQTCKAIAAFQSTQKDLKPTGKIDSDTRKRLLEVPSKDRRYPYGKTDH